MKRLLIFLIILLQTFLMSAQITTELTPGWRVDVYNITTLTDSTWTLTMDINHPYNAYNGTNVQVGDYLFTNSITYAHDCNQYVITGIVNQYVGQLTVNVKDTLSQGIPAQGIGTVIRLTDDGFTHWIANIGDPLNQCISGKLSDAIQTKITNIDNIITNLSSTVDSINAGTFSMYISDANLDTTQLVTNDTMFIIGDVVSLTGNRYSIDVGQFIQDSLGNYLDSLSLIVYDTAGGLDTIVVPIQSGNNLYEGGDAITVDGNTINWRGYVDQNTWIIDSTGNAFLWQVGFKQQYFAADYLHLFADQNARFYAGNLIEIANTGPEVNNIQLDPVAGLSITSNNGLFLTSLPPSGSQDSVLSRNSATGELILVPAGSGATQNLSFVADSPTSIDLNIDGGGSGVNFQLVNITGAVSGDTVTLTSSGGGGGGNPYDEIQAFMFGDTTIAGQTGGYVILTDTTYKPLSITGNLVTHPSTTDGDFRINGVAFEIDSVYTGDTTNIAYLNQSETITGDWIFTTQIDESDIVNNAIFEADLANGSTVDIDNTTAIDIDKTGGTATFRLNEEVVEDIIGAMLSGNTETLIDVTYNEDGTIDFVVENDLDLYDNTNSQFITNAEENQQLTLSGGASPQFNLTNDATPITVTTTGIATATESGGNLVIGAVEQDGSQTNEIQNLVWVQNSATDIDLDIDGTGSQDLNIQLSGITGSVSGVSNEILTLTATALDTSYSSSDSLFLVFGSDTSIIVLDVPGDGVWDINTNLGTATTAGTLTFNSTDFVNTNALANPTMRLALQSSNGDYGDPLNVPTLTINDRGIVTVAGETAITTFSGGGVGLVPDATGATSGQFLSEDGTWTTPSYTIDTDEQDFTAVGPTNPTLTVESAATNVQLVGGASINVTNVTTGSPHVVTIDNTAPDQTVVFTNGTGIEVTGTYPNFTVTNTLPEATSVADGNTIDFTETLNEITGEVILSADAGNILTTGTDNALFVPANNDNDSGNELQDLSWTQATGILGLTNSSPASITINEFDGSTRGLVPDGPNNAALFLDGSGNFSTPNYTVDTDTRIDVNNTSGEIVGDASDITFNSSHFTVGTGAAGEATIALVDATDDNNYITGFTMIEGALDIWDITITRNGLGNLTEQVDLSKYLNTPIARLDVEVNNVEVTADATDLNFTTNFSGSTSGTKAVIDLSNTGVSAATYGNATTIPVLAVDAKGRITSVTNTGITFPTNNDNDSANEGLLGVAAGTSTTSLLTTNTTGANDVTFAVTGDLTISETINANGGTITLGYTAPTITGESTVSGNGTTINGSSGVDVDTKNSIEIDGDELQLVGDEDSPTNGKFYGISGGNKGWYTPPTTTDTRVDIENGDNPISTNVDVLNFGAGLTAAGNATQTNVVLDNTGDWVGTFDGEDGAYYLNYNNFTNTPTISFNVTQEGLNDEAVPNGQTLDFNAQSTVESVLVFSDAGTRVVGLNAVSPGVGLNRLVGYADGSGLGYVEVTGNATFNGTTLNVTGDGTGTDNQQVTTFNIAANVLTLEIEDDGQAPHTVNLAGYLDNTDNQDLGYVASTRTVTITGGDNTILPLFSSTEAGLTPLSGGGTTNFLRADGTWAAPPTGTTYTFANGLTETTGTVDLGGDLDASTSLVATANEQDFFIDLDGSGDAFTGGDFTVHAGGVISFGTTNSLNLGTVGREHAQINMNVNASTGQLYFNDDEATNGAYVVWSNGSGGTGLFDFDASVDFVTNDFEVQSNTITLGTTGTTTITIPGGVGTDNTPTSVLTLNASNQVVTKTVSSIQDGIGMEIWELSAEGGSAAAVNDGEVVNFNTDTDVNDVFIFSRSTRTITLDFQEPSSDILLGAVQSGSLDRLTVVPPLDIDAGTIRIGYPDFATADLSTNQITTPIVWSFKDDNEPFEIYADEFGEQRQFRINNITGGTFAAEAGIRLLSDNSESTAEFADIYFSLDGGIGTLVLEATDAGNDIILDSGDDIILQDELILNDIANTGTVDGNEKIAIVDIGSGLVSYTDLTNIQGSGDGWGTDVLNFAGNSGAGTVSDLQTLTAATNANSDEVLLTAATGQSLVIGYVDPAHDGILLWDDSDTGSEAEWAEFGSGIVYNGTSLSVDFTGYTPTTRTITAGDGLSGGGNLASDVTINIGELSAGSFINDARYVGFDIATANTNGLYLESNYAGSGIYMPLVIENSVSGVSSTPAGLITRSDNLSLGTTELYIYSDANGFTNHIKSGTDASIRIEGDGYATNHGIEMYTISGNIYIDPANGSAIQLEDEVILNSVAVDNTQVTALSLNGSNEIVLTDLSNLTGYVPTSRTITAGLGLSGGGDLTSDITIDIGDASPTFDLTASRYIGVANATTPTAAFVVQTNRVGVGARPFQIINDVNNATPTDVGMLITNSNSTIGTDYDLSFSQNTDYAVITTIGTENELRIYGEGDGVTTSTSVGLLLGTSNDGDVVFDTDGTDEYVIFQDDIRLNAVATHPGTSGDYAPLIRDLSDNDLKELDLGAQTTDKFIVYEADTDEWQIQDVPAGGGGVDETSDIGIYETASVFELGTTSKTGTTSLGAIDRQAWLPITTSTVSTTINDNHFLGLYSDDEGLAYPLRVENVATGGQSGEGAGIMIRAENTQTVYGFLKAGILSEGTGVVLESSGAIDGSGNGALTLVSNGTGDLNIDVGGNMTLDGVTLTATNATVSAGSFNILGVLTTSANQVQNIDVDQISNQTVTEDGSPTAISFNNQRGGYFYSDFGDANPAVDGDIDVTNWEYGSTYTIIASNANGVTLKVDLSGVAEEWYYDDGTTVIDLVSTGYAIPGEGFQLTFVVYNDTGSNKVRAFTNIPTP